MALHERLAHTEAQLALTQQAIPHISPPNHMHIGLESQQSELQLPLSTTESTFQYDALHFMDPTLASWAQPNFNFDSMMLPIDSDIEYPMDLVDQPPPDPSLGASSSNPIFSGGDEEPTAEDLHVFHEAYFNHVHAAIPMINRHRFLADLEAAGHQRPELKSLSYGVALLGAAATATKSITTTTANQVEVEETCYHFVRKYLSLAESDDEASGFNIIRMLQACILVAYYEFERTSFARAWMSLGRAIRLGKMLGLHYVDLKEWLQKKQHFVLPLPEASCPEELEERRRAIWVLFIFRHHPHGGAVPPLPPPLISLNQSRCHG